MSEWRSYKYARPQGDLPVIFRDTVFQWIGYADTLVFGLGGSTFLEWKPTGIYKEYVADNNVFRSYLATNANPRMSDAYDGSYRGCEVWG